MYDNFINIYTSPARLIIHDTSPKQWYAGTMRIEKKAFRGAAISRSRGTGGAHGFSLVELSIVLVIIGLLVGGVLAGRSLVRASELRSISTQVTQYRTAVHAFRDRYFALPGDITNATSIWGAAADCSAQVATDQATCNGNGDLRVTWGSTANNRAEFFTFWQHLSNTGLIAGTYTGVRGPGTFAASSIRGENMPAVALREGCVSAFASTSTPTFNLMTVEGNLFTFGRTNGTANPDYCNNSMLLPEESFNLDTKLDDGLPGMGKVGSWNSVRTFNCTTSDDPVVSTYRLSETVPRCALLATIQ
jgi:prepilin-type N-terminal cleavage/methylation domain-containing protein